ncbi:hypothetical protein [Geoanaerobacter pelophilus]|uniref:hypothetical protein n=1 Tax=Geoanaerobacter pelophilus TaxID=60036 RepID=UPI00117A533D|nr:hypothetical protein [Geoanaerobacter pelophilus]
MFINRSVASYLNMLISSKLINRTYGAEGEAQYQITKYENISSKAQFYPRDVSETYLLDAILQCKRGYTEEQLHFICRQSEHGTFCLLFIGTVVSFKSNTFAGDDLAKTFQAHFATPVINYVNSQTHMGGNINFYSESDHVMYVAELDIGGTYHNQFIADVFTGSTTNKLSELGEHIFAVMTSFFIAPFFNARMMILD